MTKSNGRSVIRKPRELVLLESARQSLAEAATVEEIKRIRDKAEAARNYARAAKLGLDIQNAAATVKLEAERKAGAVLAAMNKNTGQLRRGSNLKPRDDAVTLTELGIGKTQSHRWQQEASVPEEEFQDFVEAANQTGREITSAALLKYAKRRNGSGRGTEISTGKKLGELESNRFACIYADPPWPYSNQATRAASNNHYRTMPIEEICQMDVASLAAENCHLHIWTTSSFLRETFDVIEAWGFDYRSSFVWVKPRIGLGNYWRIAHEYLCDRSHKNSYVASRIMLCCHD